jgi:hypothetical protein
MTYQNCKKLCAIASSSSFAPSTSSSASLLAPKSLLTPDLPPPVNRRALLEGFLDNGGRLLRPEGVCFFEEAVLATGGCWCNAAAEAR